MVHLFENEVTNVKEQLGMIAEELKFLVKAIMKSPKSYTLWFQRQWAIEKGLEFEAAVTQNNTTSMILENELALCDKMLKMDERNFHCWNYRYWVVDVYIREIQKRLNAGEQKPEWSDIWQNNLLPLITKEIEIAYNLITKNFSNYSAWHYRAKLLPKVYSQNNRLVNLGYIIPFDKIKEDMATLKHAFFTDPKDQSPWNYHQWLLIQISPIQVTNVDLISQSTDKSILALTLSHKVRNFQNLNVTLTTEDGTKAEVVVYSDRDLQNQANADTIA